MIKYCSISHILSLILFFFFGSFHSEKVSCMPLVPGDSPLLLYLRTEAVIAHLVMFQGRLSPCAPLLLQRTSCQLNPPPSDRKPSRPLHSPLKNSRSRETAGSRRDTRTRSSALPLLVSHFLLHLQSF